LSLTNVQNVLKRQCQLAKGQFSDDKTTADILANDQLLKAEYYRPLVIGYHNGAAVQLQDVADVEDSVQDVRNGGICRRQAGRHADHFQTTASQYH
jgi:multidrug efflux pump